MKEDDLAHFTPNTPTEIFLLNKIRELRGQLEALAWEKNINFGWLDEPKALKLDVKTLEDDTLRLQKNASLMANIDDCGSLAIEAYGWTNSGTKLVYNYYMSDLVLNKYQLADVLLEMNKKVSYILANALTKKEN